MKKKFKTLSFWTSLSGAIVVLLNVIGSCFGFNVNGDLVNQIVMAIAGVLVVLGVITMPQGNLNNENKDDTNLPEEDKPTQISTDDDNNNDDKK